VDLRNQRKTQMPEYNKVGVDHSS